MKSSPANITAKILLTWHIIKLCLVEFAPYILESSNGTIITVSVELQPILD